MDGLANSLLLVNSDRRLLKILTDVVTLLRFWVEAENIFVSRVWIS